MISFASCPSAAVVTGFDLVWELRPHRLRRLGVGAVGTPGDPSSASLHALAQGGTWASGEKASDRPRMRVSYGALQAPGVHVVPGRAQLNLRGRAKGPDGVDLVPVTEATVSLRLPVDDPAAIAPWLTRFDVSTLPSHVDGYTLHALGVTLGEPVLSADGTVSLPVTAVVEAAPTPDRTQQLVDYQSTVVVDFVLVVAEQGAATRVAATQEIKRGNQPLMSSRRGGPTRVPITLALQPGTQAAVAGLTGFHVEVDREGPKAGRYLRALTVGLHDPRTDRARQVWSASAEVRLSNAGDMPRAMPVRGEVASTVLELPARPSLDRGSWAPEAGSGCAEWPSMAPVPCPADPGRPPE